ncbi:MAG: hypothetical protein DSY89_09715 [Deltaproteobacteria bacterium]|nr:MAG: hypothetical protein DSY89_09715 [Deltaproteobacteria bacterium]
MIPIYFPFTDMPEPVADLLAAVFDQIIVLSPSEKAIDLSMAHQIRRGWLSVIAPFEDGDAALDKIVQSYRAWADLHGQDRLNRFVTQKLQASFSGESSAFTLLDEIRERSQGVSPDAEKEFRQGSDRGPGGEKKKPGTTRHPDIDIQKSRVLLAIAQEYDRRNREIQQDLVSAASIEKNFLNALHATADGAMQGSPPSLVWPEGGEPSYMLRERLAAWTCFLNQEAVSSYRIFVTTSEPVMTLLAQSLPSTEPLATINKIGINPMPGPDTPPGADRRWQGKLAQWLADQAISVETVGSSAPPDPPAVQNGAPSISLKIYRTDKSPRQWFQQAAGITSDIQTESDSRVTGPATVLVFVSTG